MKILIYGNLIPPRVLLTVILFIALSVSTVHAHAPLPSSEMNHWLSKAQSFVVSFKKDSALFYAAKLVEAIEKQDMTETPFGLKGRLAYANALVLDRNSDDMMEHLLDVRESSEENEVWDVYIETTLLIALAFENIGDAEKNLENLRLVKPIIEQHGIDSMYPFYTIQMASYYRVFERNVDSSMYYAKETIRTAPLYNLPLKEAWGNMLMAILIRDSSEEASLGHYKAAANLFLNIDDQMGYKMVYTNLAMIYFQKKQYKKALAYNDTTINISKNAINNGFISNELLYMPYEFRATIFNELEQYDSAYYFSKKATNLKLEYFRKAETAKIKEIDAQYNDEKRVQQLAEEKTKRNWLLLLALTILFSFSILSFYFLQLRKANKKNRAQTEQLKNLDSAKSRFFANVSHELRTPISLILGPIRTLLKENQLTSKQANLLAMAHQGSKNLQMLVSEILDLGKLESGRMELVKTPVQLVDYFTNYFSQFESLGHQKGVAYSYQTKVPKNATVLMDREKCRQLLFNLLSNAFKFTSPGGRVDVVVKMGNGQLYLEVRDTGKGIHPNDLPNVFDRYFQTNRPDAIASGGTGIGLALCQEYARLFGGSIDVESTLGEGTAFKVEFPIEKAEELVGEENRLDDLAEGFMVAEEQLVQRVVLANGKISNNGSKKPSVLVVEDNPDLQRYIQLVLKDQYQVELANNGQEALDHLSKNGNPDLLISDLMMPIMDGYQLLENLKGNATTQNIPTIMLTARAEKDDRLKALRIGVDDYMTKPFDEEELLVRIGNLLSNQTVRQAVAIEEEKINGTFSNDLNQADKEWLESFEQHARKHLSNNHLSVLMLADEFAMSSSTLLRQLKRLTGLTPQKYLVEIRLDKARELLAEGRFRSVARVAKEVGYMDVRGFSKNFVKRYGKNPSEYATG